MRPTLVWLPFLLALALLILPPVGQALPLDVFSTGVDSNGTVLPNGSSDPHYQLISTPIGGTTSIIVRTSTGGYPVAPNGPWIADDSISAWIAPNSDFASDGPGGTYVYQTAFLIPIGYDPATAVISGLWATDDLGLDIWLNGASTGNAQGKATFYWFTPFTITSGFEQGLNVFDIYLSNGVASTGLRFEITSATVQANAAPTAQVDEPDSLTIFVFAIGGALLWRRHLYLKFATRVGWVPMGPTILTPNQGGPPSGAHPTQFNRKGPCEYPAPRERLSG